MILAVFSASDALVIVALITALATVFGPVVLLLVQSLKRIRAAAEQAAHNTQSNGQDGTPPSPYDHTLRNQEYVIGQIHALQSIVLETRDVALDAKETAAKVDQRLDERVREAEARTIEVTQLATKIVTRINQRLDALEIKPPPDPPEPEDDSHPHP